MLGANVPGVLTAGSYRSPRNSFPRRREFWDAGDAAHAVAVDLRGERYTRLVVEVANPAATLARFAPGGVPA